MNMVIMTAALVFSAKIAALRQGEEKMMVCCMFFLVSVIYSESV
jgi:hypothetical protein